MTQKNIYIFPIKSNKTILNPYVNYMCDGLSISNKISNKGGRNYGIFDLILYIRCDIFIFNWTENLPKMKLGLLQSFYYILVTKFIKVFRTKRIIWILHNKETHNAKNKLSNMIMRHNSLIANMVVTHAQEGLSYYKNKFKKENIIYTPHPVYKNLKPILNISPIYDFILWGNIEPYKNIVKFLEFISKSNYYKDKRILICGKCENENYLHEINALITPNITLISEHIEEKMLAEMISQSRVILFCYASKSVLSSGALVYSLSYLKPIIAPNIGSFKDFEEMNLIKTYNDFSEIEEIVSHFEPNTMAISKYLIENSWCNFTRIILTEINSYN